MEEFYTMKQGKKETLSTWAIKERSSCRSAERWNAEKEVLASSGEYGIEKFYPRIFRNVIYIRGFDKGATKRGVRVKGDAP